jgi:hypothetical protein
MTVDGALAALTVGVAYFSATKHTAKLYLLLVMACLVRETGPLLLGGFILFELQAKRFVRTAVWATTALPALTWFWFVRRNLPGPHNLTGIPGLRFFRLKLGIVEAMFRPPHYHLSAGLETITRSLDVVALCAIVCAMTAGFILLRTRPLGPIAITALLYAALVFMLIHRVYWIDCYTHARVFSPLLVIVALQAAAMKDRVNACWWMLLPIPLMDLRICLQLGPQALGILRGVLGN